MTISVIDGSSLSKLGCKIYDVRIARKSCVDEDSDYPVWNIDDSVVILVSNDGNASVHARDAASKNKWDAPVSHLTVDHFLGCACLHGQTPSEVSEEKSAKGPQ